MRTQFSKIALTAGFGLALAFAFGCSSDDGGGGGNSGGNGSLSSSSYDIDHHSSSSVTGISSSDDGNSSGDGNNHSSSSVAGISSSSVNSGSSSNSNSSSIGQSSSNGGGSSGGNSSSSFVNDGKECEAIFNPDNKFCYDGTVYDKCGGNSYNPVTQGCLSGKIEEKCGGKAYSQAWQFCYDSIIYDKCNGNIYNPTTQGCLSGKVEEKCGVMVYSQATQFCYDNIIYNKCDGMVYSPATHICQNGVATPAKCNAESYNPVTQYCSNGTVKNYGSVTDTRDGKKYKITVIGTQTWMAENLNYAADNKETYYATYGGLYDWATAMALPSSCNSSVCASQIDPKHQGICPSGWHLPSNADWNVLMKFVNPSCSDNRNCAGAGTKLKSASGWNSYNGIPTGTNDFGFSALPGGNGISDGSFGNVGYGGYWWSASEDGSDYAYRRYMYYDGEYVIYNYYDKSYLQSVRCLQD
jgi:uncharacterized protein (TIGR02145 family)